MDGKRKGTNGESTHPQPKTSMASLFESIERAIEPNRKRCDPPDFDPKRILIPKTMGNGELSKKHRDTASEDCAKGEVWT